MHELYHIDPQQDSLRRFARADGRLSDALHSPTYFEDVAALVQGYLASRPDPALLEFLHYDFDGLRSRYGAVAGATFRAFPSYPRRYRDVVADQPMMDEVTVRAGRADHRSVRAAILGRGPATARIHRAHLPPRRRLLDRFRRLIPGAEPSRPTPPVS